MVSAVPGNPTTISGFSTVTPSTRPAMLKVVGASKEQTRLTSYILILFTFCGLLIIIFGGSITLNEADGNFAATVYWHTDSGYRIEFWGQGNDLTEIPQGAARGYYRQDIASNGWSKVEIETNADHADETQAYSAGLLEGCLTWQLVFWRWKNTIEATCEEFPIECEDIRNELHSWGNRMRSTAKQQSPLEPFWHQISLFFDQLDGLITGWNYAIRRNRSKHMEISNDDFLWLQVLATDVPLPDTSSLVPSTPSLTSSLIKLHRKSNKTAQEVLVAQTTAAPYRDMLRMMKKYIFPFRMTGIEGSASVPGASLVFTGYPGALSSQDDLYSVTSTHGRHSLLVVGSTIGVGISVTKSVRFKGKKRRNIEEKVAGTLRGLAASRLARDGRTWAAYFSRGRGGAAVDKQWAVVDLSKLDPITSSDPSGLLWVVEHSSSRIMASDVTDTFREQSYWATVGVPYHKDLQVLMNISEVNTSRKRAFEKCRKACNKREEVYQLVRHPVRASEDLIGARPDLYKQNPLPFGVIDTKIVTASRATMATWQVTAGPVHAVNTSAAEVPPTGAASPFQWSTSAYFLTEPHLGHPDIWSFLPQLAHWLY